MAQEKKILEFKCCAAVGARRGGLNLTDFYYHARRLRFDIAIHLLFCAAACCLGGLHPSPERWESLEVFAVQGWWLVLSQYGESMGSFAFFFENTINTIPVGEGEKTVGRRGG